MTKKLTCFYTKTFWLLWNSITTSISSVGKLAILLYVHFCIRNARHFLILCFSLLIDVILTRIHTMLWTCAGCFSNHITKQNNKSYNVNWCRKTLARVYSFVCWSWNCLKPRKTTAWSNEYTHVVFVLMAIDACLKITTYLIFVLNMKTWKHE